MNIICFYNIQSNFNNQIKTVGIRKKYHIFIGGHCHYNCVESLGHLDRRQRAGSPYLLVPAMIMLIWDQTRTFYRILIQQKSQSASIQQKNMKVQRRKTHNHSMVLSTKQFTKETCLLYLCQTYSILEHTIHEDMEVPERIMFCFSRHLIFVFFVVYGKL